MVLLRTEVACFAFTFLCFAWPHSLSESFPGLIPQPVNHIRLMFGKFEFFMTVLCPSLVVFHGVSVGIEVLSLWQRKHQNLLVDNSH